MYIEPNTIASETSYEAALLAAGCAIEAARRGGFALVRPPGHHAPPGRAMGFCLLNNVAIAARAAQAERGPQRVAIVDFDVHHGNGTQDIFWDDDTVFYVSLHQWRIFPGTRRPAGASRDDRQRAAAGRLGRRRVRLQPSTRRSSTGRARGSSPTSCSSPPASTRTRPRTATLSNGA